MVKSPGITRLVATHPLPIPTKFNVPWFTIVPPVNVFAADKFNTPAPDFTNRTLLPAPLSATTEFSITLLYVLVSGKIVCAAAVAVAF
jgi:hypothetical protein